MAKRKGRWTLNPDAPLRHEGHKRPVTRRDFLAQGLLTGSALLMGPSLLSLFTGASGTARAALSSDIQALVASCGIAAQGAGKIPFICFDLAGGANIAGSNVLVGGQDGQFDFLSTAGYNKLGLPGDMTPNLTDPNTGTPFFNAELGLAFHSDSAFLRGIQSKTSTATRANVNGAVLPARSENDTGNNPHNPMYAINRAGANGELLTLIGSRSSDSGGNSMAPAEWLDPEVRPTKIDRPSDATGLVDTGELVNLLNQADAVAVLESIQRISDQKLGVIDTKVSTDAAIKQQVSCAYVKSADLVDRYGNPNVLNPLLDTEITGQAGSIFSAGEMNDGMLRKTASVMKLVVNGYAGAGTIEEGGYDYHTGERGTGELRDFRAGQAMGACLEYAARVGVPLMLYVFSDGSVASNGRIDDTPNGRGKGEWTGDNQSTAASFFLVYHPTGRPTLLGATAEYQARHQQIGYMRDDASVETSATPGANNVNLLVQMVALNYMALHGEQGNFAATFPGHGLGSQLDTLTAFEPIVNSTIDNLL